MLDAVNSPTRRNPKNARRKAARNKAASLRDDVMPPRTLQIFLRRLIVMGRLVSGERPDLRHPSLNLWTKKLSVGSGELLILCLYATAAEYIPIVEGARPSKDRHAMKAAV